MRLVGRKVEIGVREVEVVHHGRVRSGSRIIRIRKEINRCSLQPSKMRFPSCLGGFTHALPPTEETRAKAIRPLLQRQTRSGRCIIKQELVVLGDLRAYKSEMTHVIVRHLSYLLLKLAKGEEGATNSPRRSGAGADVSVEPSKNHARLDGSLTRNRRCKVDYCRLSDAIEVAEHCAEDGSLSK